MSHLGYLRNQGTFVVRYGGSTCHACGLVCAAGDRCHYDGGRIVHVECEVDKCPNTSDPVLCKFDERGVFIPEAGCPAHDPNPGDAA